MFNAQGIIFETHMSKGTIEHCFYFLCFVSVLQELDAIYNLYANNVSLSVKVIWKRLRQILTKKKKDKQQIIQQGNIRNIVEVKEKAEIVCEIGVPISKTKERKKTCISFQGKC